MTVREAAVIYLALGKFSKNNNLNFEDAMNIVKLKNQLQNYYEIVVNKERFIINKYGQRNENGQVNFTKEDLPVFKNEDDAKSAMSDLHELYDQKIEDEIEKIKIAMPEKKGELTLLEIEALMMVVDFE